MTHAAIHKHLKKREEPVPSPRPWIRFLDDTIGVISIVFPFTVLPQIWDIWYYQETAGVSLLTWTLFLLLTLPPMVYAFVHKDKKLTIMYTLFCIAYVFVVGGMLLYR